MKRCGRPTKVIQYDMRRFLCEASAQHTSALNLKKKLSLSLNERKICDKINTSALYVFRKIKRAQMLTDRHREACKKFSREHVT